MSRCMKIDTWCGPRKGMFYKLSRCFQILSRQSMATMIITQARVQLTVWSSNLNTKQHKTQIWQHKASLNLRLKKEVDMFCEASNTNKQMYQQIGKST